MQILLNGVILIQRHAVGDTVERKSTLWKGGSLLKGHISCRQDKRTFRWTSQLLLAKPCSLNSDNPILVRSSSFVAVLLHGTGQCPRPEVHWRRISCKYVFCYHDVFHTFKVVLGSFHVGYVPWVLAKLLVVENWKLIDPSIAWLVDHESQPTCENSMNLLRSFASFEFEDTSVLFLRLTAIKIVHIATVQQQLLRPLDLDQAKCHWGNGPEHIQLLWTSWPKLYKQFWVNEPQKIFWTHQQPATISVTVEIKEQLPFG